jgi:hypothetical protein
VRAIVVLVLASGCRFGFTEHTPDGGTNRDAIGFDAPIGGNLIQVVAPGYVHSDTVTTPISYGANDLLVVVEYWNVYPNTITISDTTNLTWLGPMVVPIIPSGCDEGGATAQQILYASTSQAATTSITVAQSAAGNHPLGMYVAEYTHVALSSDPLLGDTYAKATGSGTVASAPAISVSDTTEVVAAFTDSHNMGPMSPDPGWRTIARDDVFYGAIADQVVPANTNFAPSATLAGNDACWVAGAIAFRLLP